mmetsp:Transcript_1139/g.4819  ORF Transcript_1139/g.4819 Transcript_1139/m.4819 type:complete len:204 (-) Transcript_1139:12601-13212(-)
MRIVPSVKLSGSCRIRSSPKATWIASNVGSNEDPWRAHFGWCRCACSPASCRAEPRMTKEARITFASAAARLARSLSGLCRRWCPGVTCSRSRRWRNLGRWEVACSRWSPRATRTRALSGVTMQKTTCFGALTLQDFDARRSRESPTRICSRAFWDAWTRHPRPLTGRRSRRAPRASSRLPRTWLVRPSERSARSSRRKILPF